jgi:hypothetical protein
MDSSNGLAPTPKLVNLDRLRNAPVTGIQNTENRAESDKESGKDQSSFEDLLNKIINDQLTTEKTEIQKATEQVISDASQGKRSTGVRDGFNRPGQRNDWSAGVV